MMRYLFGIVLLLVLTACGGSGNVTLHGTFTDILTPIPGYNPPPMSSCAAMEGAYTLKAVTVTVDTVRAGSSPVSWPTSKPVDLGTDGVADGPTVYRCTGTWSMTVTAAHVSYTLGLTGIGGLSGTVTVPVSQAGTSIALNDGYSQSTLSEGP